MRVVRHYPEANRLVDEIQKTIERGEKCEAVARQACVKSCRPSGLFRSRIAKPKDGQHWQCHAPRRRYQG